jgi:hypothetical protein
MGEKRSRPCADANLSPTALATLFHSIHTVCPRLSNTCNFPAMYSDKKVSPAKDTEYQSQEHPLGYTKVYRTARMSAWKASEAILENIVVRLVAYRYSGKAKGRIDRSRVWLAAVNEVCKSGTMSQRCCTIEQCSGITWTWTPHSNLNSLRKGTSKRKR